MRAYVFPGQGAQFPGMGKDLYEKYPIAKEMFETANSLLGFSLTDIMFNGTDEDLRQTKVTQPAIFLHSVILAFIQGKEFRPKMVAGHSLGEFSALVACGALSFDNGLILVSKRAKAMQMACKIQPSTIAAILGMQDVDVEEICASIPEVVVPANYNCPGQIVISGTIEGIDKAIELCKARGAKRAIPLAVSGGFHSPCMEPARIELESAILETTFSKPVCPVYQNVTGEPEENIDKIKQNLVLQLTSPVRWTQTIINMGHNGAIHFVESGPGSTLQGLIKKILPSATVGSLTA